MNYISDLMVFVGDGVMVHMVFVVARCSFKVMNLLYPVLSK